MADSALADLRYPIDMLFQIVQHYNDHGTFADGKPFIEQDDRLWYEMNVIQGLITYKKWELNPHRKPRQTDLEIDPEMLEDIDEVKVLSMEEA